MRYLLKILEVLLDLIFPRECAMCGANGKYLCDLCRKKAIHYGRPLYGNDIFAAYKYEKGLFVIALIEKLKYKFSQEIAEILGYILHERFNDFLRRASQENFVITFVPIHKKRHLWRGFNQAQMIAKVLANLSGLPLAEYLVKTRNTPPQVGLKRDDRLKNLIGAFALNINFDRQLAKNIILIDDVSTTGATIKECAKVLKAGGAERVIGMVAAKRV